MADQNLTIGIRADASQLRADLALATAQVSALGKELRAAAAESLKTGDMTGVKGLADAFELARGRATALKGEIAAISGGEGGFNAKEALKSLGEEAGKLGGAFSLIGPAITAMTTGLGGLTTALAATAAGFLELGKSAAESTRELENQATTLGLSVDQLEAYKFAFESVGVSGENTVKALDRFIVKQSEAFESGKKANDVWQESANKAEALRIEIKNLEIGVTQARQAVDTGRVASEQANDALAKGKVAAVESALAYQDLSRGVAQTTQEQLKLQKSAVDAQAAGTAVTSESLKRTQAYQNEAINSQKLALAQDALRLKQNEVVKASTENVNAFTKLGIAVTNADGTMRNTAATFDDFSEAVFKMKTAGEQAGVLKEIFGTRLFASVAAGVRLGREELEKLRVVFEKFDVSPTNIESGFAKAFNIASMRLSTIFAGLTQAFGNIVGQLSVGPMTALADMLANNKENVRAFAETLVTVLRPAFALIGRLIQGLVKPIGDLFEIFKESTGGVVAAGAAFLLLATRIGQIIAIVVVAEKALRLIFGEESTARIIAWSIEVVAAVKVLGMLISAFSMLDVAAAPWIALAAAIIAVTGALLLLFGPVQEISKFIHENFGDSLGTIFDKFNEAFQSTVKSIGEWMHNLVDSVLKAMDDINAAIVKAFKSAIDTVIEFFKPLFTIFDQITAAIGNIIGGAGQAQAAASGAGGSAAPGLAGGGSVYGPSGRDRVPIWATAGEFVHRLAAVRHYGIDFMHRINNLQVPRGFDLGGLIEHHFSPSAQNFAAGGIVAAAGGSSRSAFTLQIGDRFFDAHSDAKTVESLARAARRREIVSGGRKPSSYT